MRSLGTCFFALALLAAGSAVGRDLFVDNAAGDDRNNGQVPTVTADFVGPVRTLGRALQRANPGDRIVIANTGQPYRESVTLAGVRHSGQQNTPFAIVGNDAVFDGSAPVPPDAWQHVRDTIFRFSPRDKGDQMLFLNDRPLPRVPVPTERQNPPRLKPQEWCCVEGNIYFCAEPDKLPRDYSLSFAEKPTGISLYQVDHVAIMNLTLQGYRLDGIHAVNAARNVRLVCVTARGNARAGVAVSGACLVDLEGCTLGNNGLAQLLTLPLSETHVRSSDLLPMTAPARLDQGGNLFLEEKAVQGTIQKISTTQPKP